MQRPGDQIDIWIVEKALGSGGMGSVYRCHNRSANRILAAVKVLDPAVMRYPDAQARFIREAEILFSLDHPNIVKVRNVRTDVVPPYLEMEFVEGESLETRLDRGPVPAAECLELIAQCASAVAYMHSKGVRHRDIKPANLLVQPDGVMKLVDFGLAMETEGARITQQGMAFGTVSYAPPEWITPEALDPAMWDIYALGVVFYEMLTGRMAFPVTGEGSARQQAMQVIVAKQAHPPLDPGEAFPEDVRALVRDMTHPDPGARISRMADVEARVRALRRGGTPRPVDRPPSPRPPSAATVQIPETPEPAPRVAERWSPWRLALLGGVAGLGLLALLGAGAAFFAVGWLNGGRAVVVEFAGDLPFDVTLEGAPPALVEGRRARFRRVPTHQDLTLRWASGSEACTVEACLGDGGGCAASCAHAEQVLAVQPGRGPHRLQITVPPTGPVPVALGMVGVPRRIPVTATLAGVRGDREGAKLAFQGVSPGSQVLRLELGTCPESPPAPCWSGVATGEPAVAVPEGACVGPCLVAEFQLEVPPAGGPSLKVLDLTALELLPAPPAAEIPIEPLPGDSPAPDQAVPPDPPSEPEPEPEPEPAPVATATTSPRAGARVTAERFAAWLQDNPDWLPDGPVGRSQGVGYLAGWSGAAPPPEGGALVESASYRAARAFCAAAGAELAALDAVPGVSDSRLEWRLGQKPDKPAALGIGERLEVGVPNVLSGTVFRCAK